MALTSQITARPVFGENPLGFTALVPNNDGDSDFIQSINLDREYLYTAVVFTSADIPQTKDDFLAQVKLDLDTNWAPTVFTDVAVTYALEYQIKSITVNFTTDVADRSIWTERTYNFYVKVTVLANID